MFFQHLTRSELTPSPSWNVFHQHGENKGWSSSAPGEKWLNSVSFEPSFPWTLNIGANILPLPPPHPFLLLLLPSLLFCSPFSPFPHFLLLLLITLSFYGLWDQAGWINILTLGLSRIQVNCLTSMHLLPLLKKKKKKKVNIMRNTGLEEAQAGIKIAGRNINNLRYALATTLMKESEEELKSLLNENESGE